MRQSRLPFQPAETNDSDLVPTEEDDNIDTMNDLDSINDRLVTSKIETNEQNFQDSQSFIADLNQ